MSVNELHAFLEEKLIYYILLVDLTRTKEELKGCGLFWLVNEYCNTYAIPQESFHNCLAAVVKKYKEEHPDDEFSDEEIYAIENAFDPTNFFEDAELYYENQAEVHMEALKKVVSRISECEIDVIEEQKRLDTARTSLEKSEIKSDIAQANIAYERAKKHKENLEKMQLVNSENKAKLTEKKTLYSDIQKAELTENDDFKLLRTNQSKPE